MLPKNLPCFTAPHFYLKFHQLHLFWVDLIFMYFLLIYLEIHLVDTQMNDLAYY